MPLAPGTGKPSSRAEIRDAGLQEHSSQASRFAHKEKLQGQCLSSLHEAGQGCKWRPSFSKQNAYTTALKEKGKNRYGEKGGSNC